jgi:Flp pilus assembly protein TadD
MTSNEWRLLIQEILTNPYVLTLIFAVAFIAIFKKQIGELFGRIGYAKYEKDENGARFEVSATKEERPQPENIEVKNEEAAVPPTSSDTGNLPVDKDDWKFEFYKSCVFKQPKEAEAAYLKTLSFISDETEKKLLEIEYEEMKVRYFADTSSIIKLQALADDDKSPVRFKEAANSSLARIRSYLQEYEQSNVFYKKAIELSDSDARKVRYEVNIAENFYLDGQKSVSFGKLELLLTIDEYIYQQGVIYETIADLHEKEGNTLLRAFAAEKALSCGLENSSNEFTAGYAYSQAEFDELSLFHYQKAMKLGGGQTSMNNLAVQYERLNMPIKSVRNYLDAEEAGETLATANLAYRLLDAGFVSEAEDRLKEAIQKGDVHQNVNEAMASIPTRRENENKLEEASVKKAKELQKFYLKYAENYFKKSTDVKVKVTKLIGTGTPVEAIFDGEKLLITWEEKPYSSADYTRKYKVEATIHNRSGEAVFYEEDGMASYLKKETVYDKKGSGFVTIAEDGSLTLLKQNEYNKKDFKRLEIR